MVLLSRLEKTNSVFLFGWLFCFVFLRPLPPHTHTPELQFNRDQNFLPSPKGIIDKIVSHPPFGACTPNLKLLLHAITLFSLFLSSFMSQCPWLYSGLELSWSYWAVLPLPMCWSFPECAVGTLLIPVGAALYHLWNDLLPVLHLWSHFLWIINWC